MVEVLKFKTGSDGSLILGEGAEYFRFLKRQEFNPNVIPILLDGEETVLMDTLLRKIVSVSGEVIHEPFLPEDEK